MSCWVRARAPPVGGKTRLGVTSRILTVRKRYQTGWHPVVVSAATPVVLISTAQAGGAERALAGLARRLPALGFRPAAVLLEPGPLRRWLVEAGCREVIVAEAGAAAADVVRGLIRATGARIVVSNKWQGHVRGGRAAHAEGLPAVWWQQDMAKRRPPELEAAAVPAAAIV